MSKLQRSKSKKKQVVKADKTCIDNKKFITTSVSLRKEQERQHVGNKRAETIQKKGKKKNKISKKKQQQEKRRILDEQQRKRMEEQNQRLQQLQLLRLQQLKKLTKQQAQRLQRQFPQYYDKCRKFEQMAIISKRKEAELKEWERYVSDSEMVDVEKQKQINKIVENMKENLRISFNNEAFQRWLFFLQKIIIELKSRYILSKGAAEHDKVFYYNFNLERIYSNIYWKLQQYVRYNIDNFEPILEIKNKQLKQRNVPQLSLENEKIINEIVFKRGEERYKYEIYRVLLNTNSIKFALWFNLIKVGYRPKPLIFPQLNVELEVPRIYIQNNVVISCLRFTHNKYMRNSLYKPLGQVIQITVYPFFALPRVNKRFTLKKVTELESEAVTEKPPLRKFKFQAKETEKITIKISVPKELYVGKATELTVGAYSESQGWCKTGIKQVFYDPKQNTLRFETSHLSPFSIVIPKTADVPYKNFYLRATSTQIALLDLQTKRYRLQFQIGKSYVKLLGSSLNELKYLYEVEMHFGKLLIELQKRGLVINLSDEDAEFVQNAKIAEAENKVIEDMGFTFSNFAFKSSEFNSQCAKSEIVVKCKVHLDFESRDIPDDQNPWQHYFFNINKCGILSNKIKVFKEEYQSKSFSHINMEKAVRESKRFNQEMGHRFSWINLYPDFIVNLKSFVKELKLFSLTV